MNFFRPKEIGTINGLTLPPLLAEMVKAKRWKRPADTRLLAEVTGIKDVARLEFLKPERMAMETETLANLYRQGYGDLYGLAQSEEGKKVSDKTKVDLRYLISIMVNDDEEGAALDYRTSVEQPRVVAGTWPSSPASLATQGRTPALPHGPGSADGLSGENEKMQWKVIASDFETFARQIGLVE